MKADDFLPPKSDAPLMNTAIEDTLAYAGGEQDRVLILGSWLQIVTEYLAREGGRQKTRDVLRGLDTFVRDAQPSRDWKP